MNKPFFKTMVLIGIVAPSFAFGQTAIRLALESGSLSGPFVLTNGYVSQAVQTGVTNGGRLVFNFTLTNGGSYTIEADVEAPDTEANSFYVNLDGEPQEPAMIWDIPPTKGVLKKTVSWRATGTPDQPGVACKVFQLSAGEHQLIICGREANTRLAAISIVPVSTGRPAPPTGLHVITGQ